MEISKVGGYRFGLVSDFPTNQVAMNNIRFDAPYADDDEVIAAHLLGFDKPQFERAAAKETARRLIEGIRSDGPRLGGIDDFLQEYAISTNEGLALMVLAEALLRVPETTTADRLIEDKLGQCDFIHRETRSGAPLVLASAWAFGITARIVKPGETPEGVIGLLAKRLGLPAVRAAARQAMRILGNHFVLGETIDQAMARARSGVGVLYRYSFDMLGEGARTASDASRYLRSYSSAIDAIGKAAGRDRLPDRPGISVKLSALHHRFEALGRERVMRELVPKVLTLARQARSFDLNFTIDAEEADRLELSMEVIARIIADTSLSGWDGFGLAVQAYQKRAGAVIDFVSDVARANSKRIMIRLVKGAYWDTEIKRAQERGLDDYPVLTRKAMTDLNYVDCARKLLALRPYIYPQFATHNALTVANILHAAANEADFEFQRLHGMGDALYSTLRKSHPGIACRTYAPVGGHRELLAYLVRRLLENGANSSFVSVAADHRVLIDSILEDGTEIIETPTAARHPNLPRPPALYQPIRINSRGVEFGHRASLEKLLGEMRCGAHPPASAAPIVDGRKTEGSNRVAISPIDRTLVIGSVVEADADTVDRAMDAAAAGFPSWSATTPAYRAATLNRVAELMEARRGRLAHLLVVEAGKTIDDAISEIREAVDFCRYYAVEGLRLFGRGTHLTGPTGEENTLFLKPRGIFAAISPWNFPLAIFVGQVSAALMAGNSVVAKPAEQTPLIAAEAVRIMHEAGVSPSALQFLPGNGSVGARVVANSNVAGVVFTGSTDVARSINIGLANKRNGIVPLIAETGGINAMLVDATALPEQVTDDVVASAFRSAGQRCSALRLLCLQEEVADQMIEMIVGAIRELQIGDPNDYSTQIGPVIDVAAKDRLTDYIDEMKQKARVHYAGVAPSKGYFVAPHVFEIDTARSLDREIFGPVLHIVRYRAAELEETLQAIQQSGYGLTFGLHSRIDAMIERVERLPIGNIYVNRNMIGAVVGVQPFGGCGLSGTGPKAGGPNYLAAFATEQTVTVNTAAAGGNAALISMADHPIEQDASNLKSHFAVLQHQVLHRAANGLNALCVVAGEIQD
jgi:RHH-type transcriptional regulator, proline utilization regulon repressor / proline dehydrogenase / delta 1-pyrroline-5-carboxylate dehydrogenase